MKDALVQFRWFVPSEGFEARRTHAPNLRAVPEDSYELYLVAKESSGGSPYSPLTDHTALFKTFISTALTPTAVTQFANRYGDLGSTVARAIEANPGVKSRTLGNGEKFEDWYAELDAMHRAVTLWEAALAGDTGTLTKLIKWKSGLVFYDPINQSSGSGDNVPNASVGPELIASTFDDVFGEVSRGWVPGDLISPAWYQVKRWVNNRLALHVSARLLDDEGENRYGLHLYPKGLIGALWLQFAQSIDRNVQSKKCRNCSNWFRANRSDRRYCSSACKQKAHRARKGT